MSAQVDSTASNAPATASVANLVENAQLVDVGLAKLIDRIKPTFSESEVALVEKAFDVANKAHATQTRSSGEPYITHPITVAHIVLDMQLDCQSVMAALLHDVLEDTNTSREELVDAFGDEVTSIVDGLSKLNYLEYKSKEEAQAESFRKMLLAMVSDIRVILIKLADRLHNMRTIDVLSRARQNRIGRETLDVYAPIAGRLGMFKVKNELEDLSFNCCYPWRSQVLDAKVQQSHRNRNHVVSKIEEHILANLRSNGLNASVTGREKHLFGLYQKMQRKQLSFQEVFDMFALRVVVDDIDDCYRVLGIVHQLYTPIFNRFKDYIAKPKENGYQSLHTVLKYPDGIPVEVQIRTREMDEFAEAGIAAHWAYKEGEENIGHEQKARFWLNTLIDMQSNTADTLEFVESVKGELLPSDIYVFTPKGKIIELPGKATPVDFAYAVHSQIGNACVAAKVDRNLFSLSMPLESGQTVEIVTGPHVTPSPMWLNFVVTSKARTAIRHFLRQMDKHKAEEFGERLVKRALDRYDETPEGVKENMPSLLAEFGFKSREELYLAVGLGHHLPSQIAERLVIRNNGDTTELSQIPMRETGPLLIEGREGAVLTLSKCCCPIPGDNVQGLITAGKGIAVHRAGCRNVSRYRRRPKEWVAVDWAPDVVDHFEAEIIVHLLNQPGALARITSTMSLMNINIENMDFNNRGEGNIQIRFVLSVKDRKHLARIIRRLRNSTVVRAVTRSR